MKKILSIALALVMILALAACSGSNSTTVSTSTTSDGQTTTTTTTTTSTTDENGATTKTEETTTETTTVDALKTVEAGKLHMSTNAAFPPYEMIADNGSFEGIDVEVAGAIARKLGLELVVDDMGFDAALLAAQNGQSDIVMAGVSVTEKRMKVMEFSDSYATATQVIIVKEGSPIATADDLSKAEMIGCQKATTGYIYCSDDYGEDHVTAFENGATAVMALVNGQVDCVVIDDMPAREFVKANTGLVILDTEYVTEDYAIGMAKGNTALLDAVNGALAELTADGTLKGIVDKYITAN